MRVIATIVWNDQLQWNLTTEDTRLTLSEQDDSVEDQKLLCQWSMLEPSNYVDFMFKIMEGFRERPTVEALEIVNAIISVQNAYVNALHKEAESVDVS